MRRRDPVLFVVSMMDKEHADFDRIYQADQDAAHEQSDSGRDPDRAGRGLPRHREPLHKKAHQFKRGVKTGEYEETDIPDEAKPQFDKYYNELIESISATDDTLLEHYLEGGDISRDEAITGMKEAMKKHGALPAVLRFGRVELRHAGGAVEIVELMPNAYEMEELHAFKGAEGDATVEIHAKDDAPCAAHRLQDDVRATRRRGDLLPPLLGRDQQRADELYNATRSGVEKLNHLSIAQGKERMEIAKLHAGRHRLRRKARATRTRTTRSPLACIRCVCR